MAIALKYDATAEEFAQLAAADALEIDSIDRRSGSGNMDVGSNLGAGEQLQLGSATSLVSVLGGLTVAGALTAQEVVTVQTEEVRAEANYITLNDGYTADAAQEGGIVVIRDPSTTTDTVNGSWTAGVPATSNPTVVTTGAATFSAGEIVLITNAAVEANNGLYEVQSHASNLLTIRGIGTTGTTFNFFDDQFTASSDTNGNITKVAISVMRVGTDGTWETASGDDADTMSFSDLGAGAGNSLQQAYVQGNTIAVTTAEGVPTISNDTNSDTTPCLVVSRAPSASTAGTGVSVDLGANCTGVALWVNQQGSGNALQVQDGGGDVLVVDGAGAVDVTPTSGQDLTLTAAGAGSLLMTGAGGVTVDASAGELTFDDTGGSGITLSQASDRTLLHLDADDIYNGVTSVMAALNAAGTALDVNGGPFIREIAIENTAVIAAGDVVASSTASNRCRRANANGAAITEFLGIALTGGTGDVGGTVICKVALPGSFVEDTGASFTVGDRLYMPDGTGRPTGTKPTGTGDLVAEVGRAITTTIYEVVEGPRVIL